MVEINITAKELLGALSCNEENGLVLVDHYRRIIELDSEYYIGIYYKDFINVPRDEESIKESILFNKDIIDAYNMRTYGKTTKQRKEDLISRIESVQEEYILENQEETIQVISGLITCEDYPVGVIIPKKILQYKNLLDLENKGKSIPEEERNHMFNTIKWWIEHLMNHGVYVDYLYTGNIMVKPDDYSKVVLDQLDDLSCRVETDEYVEMLAKRGNDLRKNAYKAIEDFRRDYYDDVINEHYGL